MRFDRFVITVYAERKVSKMIKKISALLLALTLCAGALSACSSDKKENTQETSGAAANDTTATADEDTAGPTMSELEEDPPVPDPALNVNGKDIDVKDFVVCTIDDTEIKFDEFRFYYYYTLTNYESSGITKDMLREDSEKFKQFKEDVILSIKKELAAQKLADENSLKLGDDDLAAVETQYQAGKANYANEEAYNDALKQGYLTDELYRRMLERAQMYSKVMSTLFANDGVYATSADKFRELIQDKNEYAHEVHIMIPYYAQVEPDLSASSGLSFSEMNLSQKRDAKNAAYEALDEAGKAKAKADAKAVADEACKKAADGEDFFKLVDSYGWDIGLTDPSKGYYIQKDNIGGFPQALVDEAFKLDIGEISKEPVESSDYGYFIVKRLEPDMDYVEENLAALINSHDQPAIQQKFSDTIDSMKVTYCSEWDDLTAESIS